MGVINNEIISTSVTDSQPSSIEKTFDEIIKPKIDEREYLGIQLKNGLKIMLISDPKGEFIYH